MAEWIVAELTHFYVQYSSFLRSLVLAFSCRRFINYFLNFVFSRHTESTTKQSAFSCRLTASLLVLRSRWSRHARPFWRTECMRRCYKRFYKRFHDFGHFNGKCQSSDKDKEPRRFRTPRTQHMGTKIVHAPTRSCKKVEFRKSTTSRTFQRCVLQEFARPDNPVGLVAYRRWRKGRQRALALSSSAEGQEPLRFRAPRFREADRQRWRKTYKENFRVLSEMKNRISWDARCDFCKLYSNINLKMIN